MNTEILEIPPNLASEELNKEIADMKLAIEKRKNELTQKLISFKWTDYGNAERLVLMRGENIRYNHAAKKWLIWNGKYWENDTADKIVLKTKGVIRQLEQIAFSMEDDPKRDKFIKFLLRSESNNKIKSIISLAESELPISYENLDINKMMFNIDNGTIDLKTGQVNQHNRDDYITKISPVIYDQNAKCPKFLTFLNKIFENDQDIISYMQRVMGYTLTGQSGEQCMFILWGTGKNGKSTLLNILIHILGDYGMNTPASTFLSTKYESGSSNDLARLKGARGVCCVVEPEVNKHLSESLVKQATGNDTITSRFLFQEFFEYQPEFKIFLATNNKPIIKGQNEGIWRRIHLIHFKYKLRSTTDQGRIFWYIELGIRRVS